MLRLIGLALALLAGPASADEATWARLAQGGHVILIRHASTVPGVGDPPGFTLEDCESQRNLSDEGRAEARRIGEAFRARRVPVDEVLSSAWCRCQDTARLAFGRARVWSALNSNFNDPQQGDAAKNREVLARIAGPAPSRNLVLVTHNVNIRQLTGVSPAQGEMVVVAPDSRGAVQVVGRIPVPD